MERRGKEDATFALGEKMKQLIDFSGETFGLKPKKVWPDEGY